MRYELMIVSDTETVPAPEALLDDVHARGLLRVEAIARRDLQQYQWTYKRYTLRPPGSGESNPYHPDCY